MRMSESSWFPFRTGLWYSDRHLLEVHCILDGILAWSLSINAMQSEFYDYQANILDFTVPPNPFLSVRILTGPWKNPDAQNHRIKLSLI